MSEKVGTIVYYSPHRSTQSFPPGTPVSRTTLMGHVMEGCMWQHANRTPTFFEEPFRQIHFPDP